MNSHYDLKAVNTQPRNHDDWAASLDLLMQRLNALENYAGEPRSEWYGTDPRTGEYYGNPKLSNFLHMRITYEGAPARAYIRERVDYLREKIGAPVFVWKYTASIEDFDAEPHRRCGCQAAQLLEMLQAIGRKYGGGSKAIYRHYWKKTVNGVVVKEWRDPDGAYSKAEYRLEYERRHQNTYDPGRLVTYNINWEGEPYQIMDVGDYVPDEIRTETLTVTTGWSEYLSGDTSTSGGDLDWVEEEGKEFIVVVNGSGGETTSALLKTEGTKLYRWYEEALDSLECSSSFTNLETLETHVVADINVTTNHAKSYGSISDRWDLFTPEFTVRTDGSVSPVGYSVDEARGTNGDAAQIEDLIGLLHIEQARAHCDIAHLRGLLGSSTGCGAIAQWQGGYACSYTKAGIHTSYYAEPESSGGGWLLWGRGHIPKGEGGYPENLKEES